jgi:2-dehydropantoate 2-reductase
VLDEIKAQLPHLRIIVGISTVGAYINEQFIIHSNLCGDLCLGHMIGVLTALELKQIRTKFIFCNIPIKWIKNTKNIELIVWTKFAINCCINILTIEYKCNNGKLLEHNTALLIIIAEVIAVLHAYDIKLDSNYLYRQLIKILYNTFDNYNSMYQDFIQRKSTEIAYLNGYLIKLAQQKNIAVPFNINLMRNI